MNAMLPSALLLGLLVARCMIGSVVGLQPSCRTRCVVAGWQPVHCTNRSHPDGTSRATAKTVSTAIRRLERRTAADSAPRALQTRLIQLANDEP
jgi:hypothetical protein